MLNWNKKNKHFNDVLVFINYYTTNADGGKLLASKDEYTAQYCDQNMVIRTYLFISM